MIITLLITVNFLNEKNIKKTFVFFGQPESLRNAQSDKVT